MISTAEAPSVICEEFPAVTLPSSLKAGFRLASASTVESGRMPSSVAKISSVSLPSSSWTATGTISFSKRPSAVALAARWWLCTEKASSSSREMPHLVGDHLGPDALALAGRLARRSAAIMRGPKGNPKSRTTEAPMGVWVMDSTPAATAMS